jgi:guanylate kinase
MRPEFKSHFEKKITNVSRRERLHDLNPSLHPVALGEVFPEFKLFHPILENELLWGTDDSVAALDSICGCCPKFLVKFSGLVAGGKDTIIKRVSPYFSDHIFRPITATTRQPRSDEVDGVNYLFYPNNQAFLNAKNDKVFLEHVKQYGYYYGLPKQSLINALATNNSPLIFTVVEISAWSKIDKFLKANYTSPPPSLSVFVVPTGLSFKEYTDEWLPVHRPKDHRSRATRSAWELEMSVNTDILILNPIDKGVDFPAQPASLATIQLFNYLLGQPNSMGTFGTTS